MKIVVMSDTDKKYALDEEGLSLYDKLIKLFIGKKIEDIGEIAEPVPNEIIEMLWNGEIEFDDLVKVSGIDSLTPVDKNTNFLHFLDIFYDSDDWAEFDALEFTNLDTNPVTIGLQDIDRDSNPISLYVINEDRVEYWDYEQDEITIPVNESIKIFGVGNYRGINKQFYTSGGMIKVSGNIMSLIDMSCPKQLPDNAFKYLFKSTSIYDVTDLTLPNTISIGCYEEMFVNTLIEESPILPSTTLAEDCYKRMFYDCHNLDHVYVKFTNWYDGIGTQDWLGNVSSAGVLNCPLSLPETYGDSYIPENWEVYPAKTNYLCFSKTRCEGEDKLYIKLNLVDNCNQLTRDSFGDLLNIQYSFDKNNWTKFKLGENVDFEQYNKIYIRGYTNIEYGGYWDGDDTYTYFEFSGDWKVAASGDITTLLNGVGNVTNLATYFPGPNPVYDDEPYYKSAFGSDGATYTFFSDPHIEDVSKLILPSTVLSRGCYYNLFTRNTSISTSPILPATTLASSCYHSMFSNCTNLTTAPELPATELVDWCYSGMFSNCTNLTVTPELPATRLARSCYSQMFNNCTSLTAAPELPATTLSPYCYSSMFFSCTSLITAPELPATELARSCYSQMFNNCTSLTVAPELPATILVGYCYSYMFNNCTNLNSITCYATNISAANCTRSWTNNVASSGTFRAFSSTGWSYGTSGIPNNWTVEWLPTN